MDFNFRAAVPADAPILTNHRIRMMEDMAMGTAAQREAIRLPSQEYFAKAVASGEYYGCLAENPSGEVAAGGGLLFVPWPPSPFDGSCMRAIIVNMYTEPAFRRRGLARRIVDHLVGVCRERGCTSVRLNASEMGRPVYAAAGFAPGNEMVLHMDRHR